VRSRISLEPWRKNLYIMWLSQFIAMAGMSLVVPFLPFFVRELGVDDAEQVARWSGFVFAGPFFVAFFLIPVWGYLGDRYGRKLMVVRAIFGLAVSQALIGLSQNVEMLFLFRMLQGAISGFISASLALVSANTPREKSGYAIGVLQTATASGQVIGPLLGGSLADLIGFRPIFFIVAGLCIVASVLIITTVKETSPVRRNSKQTHTLSSNYRYAFSSREIRVSLFLIFFAQAAILIVHPIFALYVEYLEPVQEYLATVAGAVFSVAGLFMVIAAPWWGKRNDTSSYRNNLSLAVGGAALAYIAQGFVTSAWHLIPLRALQGFCMGGMIPTLYSYVSKKTDLSRRGGLMGIASSYYILGAMVGPSVGGQIAAAIGLRANFFITGGILLVALLLIRTVFVDLRGTGSRSESTTEPPAPETEHLAQPQ
jgi:MFS family permease